MESFVAWRWEWRILIWVFGGIFGCTWLMLKLRFFSRFHLPLYRAGKFLQSFLDRHERWVFPLLCFLFLMDFSFAKWTQLRANELHSQDFWLFVDLLEQSARGGFGLTRFAPQGPGWTQHGAVHAFLPVFLLIPLAWSISVKWILLLLNPVALTGAGVFLHLLAKKVWSPSHALMLTLSFFLSSYTSKVLMYETHPESLYPLLLLGWAWAIRLVEPMTMTAETARLGRFRKVLIYVGVILLLTLKEDAILVFAPFVLLAVLSLRKEQQEAALGSLVIGVFSYAFQLFALNQWAKGNWGPDAWNGISVTLPLAAGAQESGQSWASLTKIFELVSQLWSRSGGTTQVPIALFKFLISRPFLTLLCVVPWIGARFSFWICVLPISLLYCLNAGPTKLWNYYSAPFIAIFWLSAVLAGQSLTSRFKFWAPRWAILATCIFSAGGSHWYFPSSHASETQHQVQTYFDCLERVKFSAEKGQASKGFIGAGLIYALSDQQRDRLLYDRSPDMNNVKNIEFALFDPTLERFENSRDSLLKAYQFFSASSEWEELTPECKRVVTPPESDPSGIRLFIRKSH